MEPSDELLLTWGLLNSKERRQCLESLMSRCKGARAVGAVAVNDISGVL